MGSLVATAVAMEGTSSSELGADGREAAALVAALLSDTGVDSDGAWGPRRPPIGFVAALRTIRESSSSGCSG
ncbi:MAG TPA: hypothetical protein VGM39_22950, partial [Kofleriaceae bacterium]